jgi:hypothetical protein
MAVDYDWILELIDSQSPGDTSLSPAATEATLFFIIPAKDLTRAFYDLLGYCKISTKVWPNQQVGGLERQIPMSHPRYPMLYCDSVEIVGVSVNGNQASNDLASPLTEYANQIYQTALADPTAINYKTNPYFAVYKQYRLSVHFKAVPYFALTDEQMVPAIGGNVLGPSPKKYDYWVRDDRVATGFKRESYYDFREYLRYCTVNITPTNEVIANTNGRTFWHTAKPGEIQPPFPAPYTEQPMSQQNSPTNFQNITKNKIEITWFKVPREILNNPQYITSYGMINYGPNFNDDAGDIDVWNYEFFNFAPGTLLFTGINYRNIQTPFPIKNFSGATEINLLQNPIKNQYMDLTFTFWQYTQPLDQTIRPDLNSIAYKECGKMYSQGWNLLPAPSRNFYYVESAPIPQKNNAYPPYMSYPFPRLFDPLAT